MSEVILLPTVIIKPSAEEEEAFKSLQFGSSTPGPILKDFETFLEIIGATGVSVSATEYRLRAGTIRKINERLSRPLAASFKQVQPKRFPYVYALYLVFRSSGLCTVEKDGKNVRLKVSPGGLRAWDALNTTEQYFHLLYTWLYRADEESILSERGRSALNNLFRCYSFIFNLEEKVLEIPERKRQEDLRYYPGFYNLAMMDLFGMVSIEEGEPEDNKGWRVEKITVEGWARAMISMVAQIERAEWDEEDEFFISSPVPPVEKIQEWFHLFFPAWRHNFELGVMAYTEGLYTFKVQVHDVWRRLSIPSHSVLDKLAEGILTAFEFEDWYHLYCFRFRDCFAQMQQVNHEAMEEPPFTNEFQVGNLPLNPGEELVFVFDFGDWWEFELTIESIDAPVPGQKGVELLASKGKSPQQYW